ncbi:MAG: nicotinate phosphoribosyltransferase [Firmicutes bacterium]|uniref:Nicotinate phosphoribosyltransferase n=1 Tax=Melghirimyces thermohalophilus TaxID=1236220 RepID=A0A1G6QJ56_9BACL|nr:nicotinate phosphoribosyltransferase [Melghirimyces thermohalophilus]MDA8354250.1 nicotinate phosphoribosyltransferase [Bacillota bacterium]SDC92201.1 nicotinate phosphoribosyltransferase [Melghirimyces thermohalophilus]
MQTNQGWALHTDKYQITMMYAHWKNGSHLKRKAFDLYFRKLPFGNGFAVFAGLERAIQYLENLRFTEEDIRYLADQPEHYDPSFLDLLREFRFTGDVYSMQEGTLAFPNEPLLRLEGTVMELQLVETALLNFIGYQTLIATKAARMRTVAENDLLLEFGSRRAQETDAALWGARAAYLAGFDGTSNLKAGEQFGIPTSGTHSHAWVQDFESELDAFRAFAKAFPDNAILLVDTYDTLKSGVPHAIQVGLELKKQGHNLAGIRLDSGDLAFLSKKARKMLDEAGLTDTKIVASSDLDEDTLLNLKSQGARVDSWGVGTRLITAYDQPSLGAVYKLVARDVDGQWQPTIKISSNPEKVTTPGVKTVHRIIDRDTGKARGDLITPAHKGLDEKRPLTLFHPVHTYRKKKVHHFRAVELLTPVIQKGQRQKDLPTLEEARRYHQQQRSLFWEEYLRLLNPEEYPVDLSKDLWETKQELIQNIYRQIREENGK